MFYCRQDILCLSGILMKTSFPMIPAVLTGSHCSLTDKESPKHYNSITMPKCKDGNLRAEYCFPSTKRKPSLCVEVILFLSRVQAKLLCVCLTEVESWFADINSVGFCCSLEATCYI